MFAEITGDRPGQPAYEFKLMLSCISWALAQISIFRFFSSLFLPLSASVLSVGWQEEHWACRNCCNNNFQKFVMGWSSLHRSTG